MQIFCRGKIMSNSQAIKLAFVVDQYFFKYLMVTLASVVDHSTSDFDVYILQTGIDESVQKKCIDFFRNKFTKNNINFNFIEFDRKKFEAYDISNKNITLTTFAKFEIPTLIQEDKILYLDSDLVILRDLKDLWDRFDDKYSVMAVANPQYPKWKDHEAIGLIPNQKSFNAGVIYFNCKKIRELNKVEELYSFTNNSHNRIKLHDESAFNFVFQNDWLELPAYFNATTLYFRRNDKILGLTKQASMDLRNKLTIVHFTGVDKPWNFISPHPINKEWQYYYKMCFGEFKYQNISFINLFKKIARKIKFILSYNRKI